MLLTELLPRVSMRMRAVIIFLYYSKQSKINLNKGYTVQYCQIKT